MRPMQTMHTPRQWALIAALAAVVLVVLPILNLVPAASSPLRLADHLVPLLGKFLCLALVALALDLVWGYAGILSLGHTVFFAIGGYSLGMYLMRAIGQAGVYRSELPDFMVFLDWKELPRYWHGFDRLWFASAMAVALPALLALVFGTRPASAATTA
jgi:urea transport system permease protein